MRYLLGCLPEQEVLLLNAQSVHSSWGVWLLTYPSTLVVGVLLQSVEFCGPMARMRLWHLRKFLTNSLSLH